MREELISEVNERANRSYFRWPEGLERSISTDYLDSEVHRNKYSDSGRDYDEEE